MKDGNDNNHQLSPHRHALASNAAGCIATFVFNPLEIVRTRFMSQDGTSQRTHGGIKYYTTTAQAMRDMYTREGGGVRIFFRGAHVAALASGFSHGVYMLCYRQLLSTQQQHRQQQQLGFSTTFACSVTANIVVAYVTNPIWLVKTRLQLYNTSTTGSNGVGDTGQSQARSAVNCIMQSVRSEGPFVFWRGTSAQLLLSVPSSLHLPLYEALLRVSGTPLKRMEQPLTQANSGNSNVIKRPPLLPSIVACNVVAKTLVTIMCHPFTVMRTRLQDVKARSGDVQYHTLRDVGVAACGIGRHSDGRVVGGIWRGLQPSLIQVVPRSVAHIALYEMLLSA